MLNFFFNSALHKLPIEMMRGLIARFIEIMQESEIVQ